MSELSDELTAALRASFADVRPFANPDEALRQFDWWLAKVKAAAWDEGHKHWWRRGPDNCHCAAWSSSECGCGEYGTGELLSLKDNPYRKDPE